LTAVEGVFEGGCHSCRLCDLACSSWRFTGDGECAPRAVMLWSQRGEAIDIQKLAHCTLCAACDAACPLGLRPMRMIMELASGSEVLAAFCDRGPRRGKRLLLGGDEALSALFPGYQQVRDGVDALVAALGNDPAAEKAQLQPLRSRLVSQVAVASRVMVVDGLLYYALRQWLPAAPLLSLAEALLPRKREALQEGDLLLLDAPAFNSDRSRLLPIVQRAVMGSGAILSLDLQRLAMPLDSCRVLAEEGSERQQALRGRWLWLGQQREIRRVVTENPAEAVVAASVSGLPAIWLGAL